MKRIVHSKLGPGVILEMIVTQSGKPAALVVFDFEPANERAILLEFLSDCSAPIPKVATEITRKRKTAPKPEKISDNLLVPRLDDNANRHFEEHEAAG